MFIVQLLNLPLLHSLNVAMASRETCPLHGPLLASGFEFALRHLNPQHLLPLRSLKFLGVAYQPYILLKPLLPNIHGCLLLLLILLLFLHPFLLCCMQSSPQMKDNERFLAMDMGDDS